MNIGIYNRHSGNSNVVPCNYTKLKRERGLNTVPNYHENLYFGDRYHYLG